MGHADGHSREPVPRPSTQHDARAHLRLRKEAKLSSTLVRRLCCSVSSSIKLHCRSSPAQGARGRGTGVQGEVTWQWGGQAGTDARAGGRAGRQQGEGGRDHACRPRSPLSPGRMVSWLESAASTRSLVRQPTSGGRMRSELPTTRSSCWAEHQGGGAGWCRWKPAEGWPLGAEQ